MIFPSIYVRAIIPTWGAQKDDDGKPLPLPALEDGEYYSPWFIGSFDAHALQDDRLNAMIAKAKQQQVFREEGAEMDDFVTFLEDEGYLVFTTPLVGDEMFVANLPDAV